MYKYHNGNMNKENIDVLTDFSKDRVFKSLDGGEYASMEDVRTANNEYWDSMMIDDKYIELENAYFDYITYKFGLYDIELCEENIENMIDSILLKYVLYLNEKLKQFDLEQQDNNRGPKR